VDFSATDRSYHVAAARAGIQGVPSRVCNFGDRHGKLMQKWLQRALLAAGGVFCVTAMLYCVMIVRADRASRATAETIASTGLDRLISEYGQTALIVELIVLGLIVALVIWSDGEKKVG
jgi:hypothetical protein